MRISTIVKGIAATALLSSFGLAQAAHLPSPCAAGEVGAGSNCAYLVLVGSTTDLTDYDGVTGNRTGTAASTTYSISVWIDFNTENLQGGAFDILFDTTNVTSMNWNWGTGVSLSEQTSGGIETANGYEKLQLDDFATSGYYLDGVDTSGCPNPATGNPGTMNPVECHIDGFQSIGTLELTVAAGSVIDFMMSSDAYTRGTFPNCWAPGADSSNPNPDACANPDYYSLTVAAPVPLPAAVWMMIAGLGSLAGFSRRKA